MPLQNRVDPFGAIHAVPERGLFTGNRGIIHDPETKTLLKKRWALAGLDHLRLRIPQCAARADGPQPGRVARPAGPSCSSSTR